MFDNCNDTLLAHHAYASHFPQRLAWVVSEYCDSAPWKLQFKGGAGTDEKGVPPAQLPAETLCEYNAVDARLTAKVWPRMQKDLEPERHVYEHDLELARVCHEMTYQGIGVDRERMALLQGKCARRRAALKGVMRREIGEEDFAPGKLGEVRRVLFEKLHGRFIRLTGSGLPSTNDETLEALSGDETRLGRFAWSLLQWRLVGKVKSTYLDAVTINPRTGRAHYNWKPFGTVSGRLSCRLQSCPRWAGAIDALGKPVYGTGDPEERVREIYATEPGRVYVYFDVSQAEMRIAAYISNDAKFMAACAGDIHSNNAKMVFPKEAALGYFEGEAKKDPKRGKPYRDICKNFGFAICYGAEAVQLYLTLRRKGFPITMQQCEVLLTRLRGEYRTYYRFVAHNVEEVRRCGYMRTPVLGRIRWLGWYPKPTDVSNFPVQSCLADVMNARMIALAKRLPKTSKIVAQVHDALLIDCPVGEASTVEALIRELWAEGVKLAGGDLVLPIDMKRGERWSDMV